MATSEALRIDPQALEEADRQLALLADAMLEEEGDVRPWVIAARHAIHHAQEAVDDV